MMSYFAITTDCYHVAEVLRMLLPGGSTMRKPLETRSAGRQLDTSNILIVNLNPARRLPNTECQIRVVRSTSMYEE